MGMYSLLANGRLRSQGLSKDDALVAPLQAFFYDCHGHPHNTEDHHGPLVVEVAHDHDKSLVFLTQQILHRDLDILELHVGSRGGGRVCGLDLFGLDAFTARNQEHRETLISSASGHKVVGEHAVSDPFPKDVSLKVTSSQEMKEKTDLVPLTM